MFVVYVLVTHHLQVGVAQLWRVPCGGQVADALKHRRKHNVLADHDKVQHSAQIDVDLGVLLNQDLESLHPKLVKFLAPVVRTLVRHVLHSTVYLLVHVFASQLVV